VALRQLCAISEICNQIFLRLFREPIPVIIGSLKSEKTGSLESEKIIIGSLKSEKIRSLELEKPCP